VATKLKHSDVRILIADDDLEILRILRKQLTKRGYSLLEAHDGEQALETALVERPNLILLDVMMPQLNGWEVCRYLRSKEEYNDVGIVMLTAIGPKLNELTSPLYGADHYIDKPFDFADVEEAIVNVLESRCGITLVD
jgi:DNA-binding response OmpR family regulator